MFGLNNQLVNARMAQPNVYSSAPRVKSMNVPTKPGEKSEHARIIIHVTAIKPIVVNVSIPAPHAQTTLVLEKSKHVQMAPGVHLLLLVRQFRAIVR